MEHSDSNLFFQILSFLHWCSGGAAEVIDLCFRVSDADELSIFYLKRLWFLRAFWESHWAIYRHEISDTGTKSYNFALRVYLWSPFPFSSRWSVSSCISRWIRIKNLSKILFDIFINNSSSCRDSRFTHLIHLNASVALEITQSTVVTTSNFSMMIENS